MKPIKEFEPIIGDDLPLYSMRLRDMPLGCHLKNIEIAEEFTPLTYAIKDRLLEIAEHHYRNYEVNAETPIDFIENVQDSWNMASMTFEARLRYIDAIDFDMGNDRMYNSLTNENLLKTTNGTLESINNASSDFTGDNIKNSSTIKDSDNTKNISDSTISDGTTITHNDASKTEDKVNDKVSSDISNETLTENSRSDKTGENTANKTKTDKIEDLSNRNVVDDLNVSESETFDNKASSNSSEISEGSKDNTQGKTVNVDATDNKVQTTTNTETANTSENDTKDIKTVNSENANAYSKENVTGSDTSTNLNESDRYDIDVSLDANNTAPHSRIKTDSSENGQSATSKESTVNNNSVTLSDGSTTETGSKTVNGQTSVNGSVTDNGTKSETQTESLTGSENSKDSIVNSENSTENGTKSGSRSEDRTTSDSQTNIKNADSSENATGSTSENVIGEKSSNRNRQDQKNATDKENMTASESFDSSVTNGQNINKSISESSKDKANEISESKDSESYTKNDSSTNSTTNSGSVADDRKRSEIKTEKVTRFPNEQSIDIYTNLINKYPNIIREFVKIFENDFIIYDYLVW